MGSNLLQCYNKGCGLKFDPNSSDSQSCTYHPGPPFFHDAYKIWNCCNQKSTDFTTWLSYPGCTKGAHNPEKPAELPKPVKASEQGDVQSEVETHTVVHNKPPEAAVRKEDEPLVELPRNIHPQVTVDIANHKSKVATEKAVTAAAAEDTENNHERIVPVGTPCRHAGCQGNYQNSSSRGEECWYHPGTPIFHEGLKYWSCCRKTTTDFDNFLSQEGCTVGRHQWFENLEKSGDKQTRPCRYDWHQTASRVTLTFYTKGAVPDDCRLRVNGVTLRGVITYAFGHYQFPIEFPLWGRIAPLGSSVSITPSKVELTLIKDGPAQWVRLLYDADRDAPRGTNTNASG